MSYTATTQFKEYGCAECGIDFAIGGHAADQMERDHLAVYCPRGHKMRFSDETELDKLRAKALRLESQLEYAKHLKDNAVTTAKRERTRRKNIEKRAACGLCPYCSRSFAATRMQAHVRSKHPDKVSEEHRND